MPLPRSKFNIQQPSRTSAAAWNELEKTISALPEPWRESEIVGLENLKTLKFKETETDFIVLAELTSETECRCGAAAKFKKNGMTPPQMINDLPIRHKRVSLYYRAQRYFCSGCHATTRQQFPECSDNHRLTQRLVSYIERKSLNIDRTFSGIALETGVREHVIRNIFTDYAIKLQSERTIVAPGWLAFDEVCPTTGKYRRCVISDPENRKILELLGDDKSATIKSWLEQLKELENVKVVSMDMHTPYKAVIEEVLPKAKIVVDRYHAQDLLNNSVKEVLDVIRASLTVSERQRQMRPEHLPLKNRHTLSQENKEVLNRWFAEMPDVARSYTLKEDFADILHLSDKKQGEKRMTLWLEQVREYQQYFYQKYEKQCRKLRRIPFGNILKTVSHWFHEILNYIEFKNKFSIKVTNAFAEYANNQIKKGFRKGNGYNFEVLRCKVVFGDFLKEKFLPHPLKPKTGRGHRKTLKKAPVNRNSNVNRLIKAREDKDEILTIKTENNPLKKSGYRVRFSHITVEKPFEKQYDPPSSPRSVELQQDDINILVKQRVSEIFSKRHNDGASALQERLPFEMIMPTETIGIESSINKEKFAAGQMSLFAETRT